MKISKKDALTWFEFFAQLPPEQGLSPRQLEIGYGALRQIEEAVQAMRRPMLEAVPGLRSLEGRTLYVGNPDKFPQGCRSCLLGSGLGAVRRTNRCNIACPFCYNYGELDQQPPVGEGLWEIGGTKYALEDIDLLLRVHKRPTGVAYVYLEPFMEIEAYYPLIEKFHQAGVYQHMYTNGTLATRENLQALGRAGLDELRFNLGATGCAPQVIGAMAAAKEYIPRVGVETPMTPQFFQGFLDNQGAILAAGIDFINCAELHLNPNNLQNYWGESLYMTRLGYLSPIWSRNLTLQLMAMAGRERWPIAVHDCSNMTKFARDMHLRAREGGWFGSSDYACEFDPIPWAAFLPALRDPQVVFQQEEPLPPGYRPGDLAL